MARVLVVGGAGRARELAVVGARGGGGRGRRPGPPRHPDPAARGRDGRVLAVRRSGPARSTATGWRRWSSTSSTRRCAGSSTSARRRIPAGEEIVARAERDLRLPCAVVSPGDDLGRPSSGCCGLEAAAGDRVDRQGEGDDRQQDRDRHRGGPGEARRARSRPQARARPARAPAGSGAGGLAARGRRSGSAGSPARRGAPPPGAAAPGRAARRAPGPARPRSRAARAPGRARAPPRSVITSWSRACQSLRSCSTQRSQLARCAARRRGPGSASSPSSSSDSSRSARSHQPLPGSGKAARRSALRARASASASSARRRPVSAQTSGRVRPTRSTSDERPAGGLVETGQRGLHVRERLRPDRPDPTGRWGTGRRAARSIAAEDSPTQLRGAVRGARRSGRWRPTRSGARRCRWAS